MLRAAGMFRIVAKQAGQSENVVILDFLFTLDSSNRLIKSMQRLIGTVTCILIIHVASSIFMLIERYFKQYICDLSEISCVDAGGKLTIYAG